MKASRGFPYRFQRGILTKDFLRLRMPTKLPAECTPSIPKKIVVEAVRVSIVRSFFRRESRCRHEF